MTTMRAKRSAPPGRIVLPMHTRRSGASIAVRPTPAKPRTTKRPNRRSRPPAPPIVVDEIEETLQKTRVQCQKSRHYEAFWVMRQTQAADEPTTHIYRCVKCQHTWREY